MKHLFVILSLVLLNTSCVESQTVEENLPYTQSKTFNFKTGVRAICLDKMGNLWLGSHQEGVCFYDGISFHYFTNENGLPDNQIRSIQTDSSKLVWIETATGICVYDGWKIVPQNTLSNGSKTMEWNISKNDLWFGAGIRPGVIRYDNEKLHYLPFPQSETATNLNYLVTATAKGKNRNVWISTYTSVYGYSNKGFEILTDEFIGPRAKPGSMHVRSIFEDSKGRLWIGNNGIGVLLKDEKGLHHFSEEKGLIHADSKGSGQSSPPETLEHVFAITEDSQGNIWFGDRDTGAWKYDGTSLKNYTIDENLKSNMIWTFYQLENGPLLLGMAEGGVYDFQNEMFKKLF